MHLHSHKR